MRDEEMLQEIEDFLEGFNQPTYRGMRINGSGWLRGHPSKGGPGIRDRMRRGSQQVQTRRIKQKFTRRL